jgi:uncharacterized protein (DUF488 family)
MMETVFTIGHSNHSPEHFLALLEANGIRTVVDTRSNPRSKYNPQFDAGILARSLEKRGIRYVFMGRELGGRPTGDHFYDADGHVLYGRVAESPLFLEGLDTLARETKDGAAAVLCSEEDPSVCHRRLLIARVLHERGVAIRHIRGDGSVQSESELQAAEAAEADEPQMALFEHTKVPEWKSIPSVLPKKQRSSSSSS